MQSLVGAQVQKNYKADGLNWNTIYDLNPFYLDGVSSLKQQVEEIYVSSNVEYTKHASFNCSLTGRTSKSNQDI